MTKKNDPFQGAEIEQDSEPLRFEEATSLFDEGSVSMNPGPSSDQAAEEVVYETSENEMEPIMEEEVHEEESSLENEEDGVHTIGAFLKQMREEKSINLKIISQHTKISVTNLELLEADQLEKLPNRAYVIGYVKSYAKALQLNQGDCLELLDVTYGIEKEVIKDTSPSLPNYSSNTRSNKDDEDNSNGIKVGIIVGAIAIGAFLLILNNTGQKDEEIEVVESAPIKKEVVPQTLGASTPLKGNNIEEELKVTSVEVEKPEVLVTPIPQKQLEEIKKTEPVVKAVPAVVKPEPIVPEVKPEPVVKEKVKLPKDKKISFHALSANLYSDDKSMSKEDINKYLPNKYRAAIVPGQHNIFINAVREDSWLTYKSDDGPIKKFILRKGRTILIRGKLVRVFLGNLGAVKIFKNNVPQRILSTSGVKSLVFPQDRGSEFVIPLFIFNKNGGVQTSEDYLVENPED